MNCREWFLLKNNSECFYDTAKLFLSTVFGILLGLNLEIILNVFYRIVSVFGDNQIIMLMAAIGISILCEFIIDLLPEYIMNIVFDILNAIGFSKRLVIFNNIVTYLILITIRVVNYIFVFLIISFMFISVLKYGENDDSFFYNELHTYKISKNIVNQMIDSDYMQYFIRKNEVYNGVNMEKAMEIDSEIELEARKIIDDSNTDLEKARVIYNWVGTNIIYDDSLAENIGNKEIDDTFGAKYAFYNRSGVCFEFATLFGAMANSVGLQVKVVIGQAYNGIEFGPHAWNEVYLEEEKRWISVDPTFWGHNSSFDSDAFDFIHKKERIAWESTIN